MYELPELPLKEFQWQLLYSVPRLDFVDQPLTSLPSNGQYRGMSFLLAARVICHRDWSTRDGSALPTRAGFSHRTQKALSILDFADHRVNLRALRPHQIGLAMIRSTLNDSFYRHVFIPSTCCDPGQQTGGAFCRRVVFWITTPGWAHWPEGLQRTSFVTGGVHAFLQV